MGSRVRQVILQCDICGVTPDNGEYMWYMDDGKPWCESCCENPPEDNTDDEEK